MIMNGLTITEIAQYLGISREAAKTRIIRGKIQPKDHAGKTNIYDESVVDQLRDVPGKGRPKKDKTP
jgi:predicted site-specific integrase-resolvase